MTALKVTPLALSSIVLAAHFYRSGNPYLAAIALIAPLLLVTRRAWAVAAVQVALFAAAAEWVRTALSIAAMRKAVGAPSARMLFILAAVALFTVLSALPLTRINAR
ncbi:MAG TPA: hypothetical protein VF980_14175 [Thermoanaerobaculia bacterium]